MEKYIKINELLDFFYNKLNNKKFEELSFANSYITMPKKDFKNFIYFAEEQEQQEEQNSSNFTSPSNYTIEVEEPRKSIFQRIKDFLKPKPKTYLLDTKEGSTIEIDGTVPGNPFAKLAERITKVMEKFNNKPADISKETSTINSPEIYSESLAVVDNKAKESADKSTDTLSIDAAKNNIIPKAISEKAPKPSIPMTATPKATPSIEVASIDMEDEELIKDNADVINKTADSIRESDTTKVTETKQTPTQDQTDPNKESNSLEDR